ncbi:hypothetical protein GURASL_01350 [Geotalea uraniireducens]|uniref:GmrSD restriction endonucleases N-terminal domain-containing protein n=1 Tax=Geotalea uraniireducens TaxID=351604 RepID=A0ABN6VPK8_9BACT|nr:DUF262 domain-containing protein [Geotalea uraniireducens]BDV41212.1 hypothetical protein GURASL_01350 [Geotalea uraniireducens]
MNENEHDINPNPIVEEPEGLDTSESSGWDEYPLDALFVRKDQRTVKEVMSRIEKGRYVLDPDFQRDFVWPPTKQSRLIESCLMRIPLPVFYVAEAKDGKIVVVDGLQRLTTFYRFINNQFSLTGLGEGRDGTKQESPLLNKKFNGLSITLQERLEDTQLTLYILDAKAPERAKLDIFERVNGGVPLTRQQMRNCLFNGNATKLLKRAAENELFLKVTGGSLDKKSMRDREVINRFYAFYLLGVDQYKADMDDFLAKALEKMNQLDEESLRNLEATFKRTLNINYNLFEKHAFRKSLALKDKYAGRTVINIALFDVCTVIFSELTDECVEQNSEKLKNIVCDLVNDYQFIQAITYATNGLFQVRTRFNMMRNAIAEVV